MLYLLEVDVLIASFVFAGAGLIILTLLAWQQARVYIAVLYSIQKRLISLIESPWIAASLYSLQ